MNGMNGARCKWGQTLYKEKARSGYDDQKVICERFGTLPFGVTGPSIFDNFFLTKTMHVEDGDDIGQKEFWENFDNGNWLQSHKDAATFDINEAIMDACPKKSTGVEGYKQLDAPDP